MNNCLLDCQDPSPSNGFAATDNGSTLDNLATVSCNPGYALNGSTVLTCTALGWNDSVTCNLQGNADIFSILLIYNTVYPQR